MTSKDFLKSIIVKHQEVFDIEDIANLKIIESILEDYDKKTDYKEIQRLEIQKN